MTNEKEFEPAFPFKLIEQVQHGNDDPTEIETTYFGLSKREYFAGLAMQGILSTYTDDLQKYMYKPAEIKAQVTTCIQWADELIKQLNQE